MVDRSAQGIFAAMAEFRGQTQELREIAQALKNGDGGGTSGGMDAWQQSVETRLGDLSTDIRDLGKKVDGLTMWIVGAIATGFLVVLGLINAKADQVTAKLDLLTAQTAQISERVAKVEVGVHAKLPAASTADKP